MLFGAIEEEFECLTESLFITEKGLSSSVDDHREEITDWQEELVSFTKNILCAIQKDIGPNLKQVVWLAEIGYDKSLLNRQYCQQGQRSQVRLKRLRPVEYKTVWRTGWLIERSSEVRRTGKTGCHFSLLII